MGDKVFKHTELGEIRTVCIDNQIYFVGIDVCNALGYKNISSTLSRDIDDSDKIRAKILEISDRSIWLINEYGFQSMIYRSNTKNAESVRKWAKEEIFPYTRGYADTRELREAIYNLQKENTCLKEFNESLKNVIKQKNDKIFELNVKIEVIESYANLLNSLINALKVVKENNNNV